MALTNQQQLQNALAANIAALAQLYAQPRPDGSVDGRSNQWTAMRMALLKEQQEIRLQILMEDAPFEATVYPFES